MSVIVEKLPVRKLEEFPEFDRHERVVRFSDQQSGLLGFIAIHRKRGPLSTGGTRFFDYADESLALRDVLRLSKAMSAKCVVAGLPYGGAKAVIIGDPKKKKTRELLSAYAEVVASLEGVFRTGEDVGMTEADVQFLLTQSNFFNGKSDVAGDPSPFAAQSTHVVMKSILEVHRGRSALSGLRVAVRGVGKVGAALAGTLAAEHAELTISDIDHNALQWVSAKLSNTTVISNDDIPFLPVDVYAPCAMGNEVTDENVQNFRAAIICGGANNQLAHQGLADILERNGTLFVPDYLANAGGLINVSDELEADGYHRERVNKRIDSLGDLAKELYGRSKRKGTTLLAETERYVGEHLGV